ncbi:MAG: hypothetical protein H0U79_03730, partial [Solirubrobacterales bacterium]|nr:hypothetical protein [Solirubrobacterales bacterium]
DLLDMRVDPQAARRLTRSIVRAQRRGRPVLVRRLRALRAAADERFDPAASLRGTARYLRFAREQLGRDDLALAAYHMGVGNLQAVQRAFGSREASYVELYFDSSPLRHRRAWRLLSSLGDDSATYLWRLRAAREVMKRFREDPEDLGRRAALMTAKNSAEEVLHPPDETETFEDGEALREAYDDDELLAIDPALLAARGLRSSRQMGELARDPRPYRGLRREALAALVYIGAGTRAITGAGALTLTSTVRDRPYQRRLVGLNPQATRGYSLHTTGFAFDLAKRFRSADQEAALRFVLRRLQAHDLIAYVEEFGAFHVVAGEEASVLQGVLEPDEG